MGIILCKKHGRQFFHHTCKHIYKDFTKGNYIAMVEFPVLLMKVCEACYAKEKLSKYKSYTIDKLLSLPEGEALKIENELSEKYDRLKDRACICKECMKEIQLKYTRKLGETDPFECYENTLLYEDKEIIDDLNTFLLKQYTFENLQFLGVENMPALLLRGGGISHPFSITIYYVITPQEQSKVLALIEHFFQRIDKKQRVVRFFEKVNWSETKNGGRTRDEKLLLEQIIK